MKDFLTFIQIIFVIAALIWLANRAGSESCKKYGPDWEYRGGYVSRCVNSNGDIKGI